MKKKIKINFEDFWHPKTVEEIKRNPIFKLLSRRFDLEIVKDPDYLIYSCGDNKEFLKYRCIRIFYTGENIRPNFNECDYAFSFDYPVTDRNYRLPFYKLVAKEGYIEKLTSQPKDLAKIMQKKKKFCNFVYSNDKAQERIYFFSQLQQYKRVDSGGKVMNNLGYYVDDKISFLNDYKFTIAFENSCHPGYTTEKILHPFLTNSIPIYWGNPLVFKDFNPKAFINCHNYSSFKDVIQKIIEVDTNDDLYQEYIRQPAFNNNVENEYINEENILERFEEIFSTKKIEMAAKRTDILKYGANSIYNRARSLRDVFIKTATHLI